MSKIKYIKEGCLVDLKAQLPSIINHYKKEDPWLSEYFGQESWFAEVHKDISDINSVELKPSDPNGTHYDFENAKTLYSALCDLPLYLAIDERFWSFLSHVVYWDYMKTRWPLQRALETKNPAEYIREHYFFMPNRDRRLIRNGISRLWWYGYISYDQDRDDPFELTAALLEKLDIASSLLERSFSRNPLITKALLRLIVEKKSEGQPITHREKVFRPLMKHFNNIGGVTILDALSQVDIIEIAEKKVTELVTA